MWAHSTMPTPPCDGAVDRLEHSVKHAVTQPRDRRRGTSRRMTSLTASTAVLAALVVAAPMSPAAAQQNGGAGVPETPRFGLAYVTGGIVHDIAVANDVAYVVGEFTQVRENRNANVNHPRANIYAYDINTGQLDLDFAPVVEGGTIAEVEVSPAGDAVFIGGGLSEAGMVERCWQALKPHGRLVANAVTLQSEAALFAAQQRFGGELTRLSVARAGRVGGFLGWRPLMPVTQWTARK